jgi:hypothetical protein
VTQPRRTRACAEHEVRILNHVNAALPPGIVPASPPSQRQVPVAASLATFVTRIIIMCNRLGMGGNDFCAILHTRTTSRAIFLDGLGGQPN